ncbi:MAG: TetR/AcrR family transcriptional regulator [Hyphomicrobiales bacterium]|nr:TetR/AcrR family transcriptional regulator [Hyphomicrobiales bacterium]
MGNVGKSERSYHHGQLRSALISQSLRILEAGDVERLSLREVARAAGVSATAVYRHFPNKEALLRAVSSEGFYRLDEAQSSASLKAGGGVEGFNASGAAYVRFALSNSSLFRLMFNHSPDIGSKTTLQKDVYAVQAMRHLQEAVAALIGVEVDDPRTRSTALRAWSLVHGLSLLILDGQVEADSQTIEETINIQGAIGTSR